MFCFMFCWCGGVLLNILLVVFCFVRYSVGEMVFCFYVLLMVWCFVICSVGVMVFC